MPANMNELSNHCQSRIIRNAMVCSLCKLRFHVKCMNTTSNQIRAKKNLNKNWYCSDCMTIFPFSEIDKEELVFINSDIEVSEKLYQLYDDCSDFKLGSLDSTYPDLTFYDKINIKCDYFTEAELSKIQFDKSLSIIHINCRNMTANFDVIRHFVQQNNYFDVITLTETSMAMLEFLEEVTSSLDKKKTTIGVFIDLKKAFDRIDHTLILKNYIPSGHLTLEQR